MARWGPLGSRTRRNGAIGCPRQQEELRFICMISKRIFHGLFWAFIFIFVACEKDDGEITCRRLCDDKTEASIYDAEVHQCSISKDAVAEYEAKCRTDCSDVLEFIVERKHRPEAVDCLDCLHDEVQAEPTVEALAQARDGECFPVCKERGASQFFASFYVTAPEWDCR